MNIDKPETLVTHKKKIGRKLKPTDSDFVAPDGGWGWLVAFACGLSNLSIFLMYQQFGLIFTDKFQELGITHTQTTTIININLAFTSCVGIFNGPIYKRFTFRQVGLFGSSLVVGSLLVVTWCESFWTYFTFYSLIYGTSVGLTQSANALALNTYFKKKRSIATGLSWGTTRIGPIVWPHVITVLLSCYGMEGTVLFFAGFAGHAIMCSLLLQPVHWHTKCRDETDVPLMDLSSKSRRIRSNSLPVYLTILEEPTISIHPFDYIDSSNQSINAESADSRYLSKNIKHWISASKKLYYRSELIFNTNDTNCRSEVLPNGTDLNSTDSKSGSSFLVEVVKFFDLDVLKDLKFSISLFVAVVIGFGKGLIIIYLALLIPNHVSLKKLPAALGIYLAFFGIFLILMAPVAGWIRDHTQSYVTTVHILQILIYIATLSWIYEYFSKKGKLQSKSKI